MAVRQLRGTRSVSRRRLLHLLAGLAAGVGALASGAAAMVQAAPARAPTREETPGAGHSGHSAAAASFPGATGAPGQLDSLLYPPEPLPAQPGRLREYTLVAMDTEIEVAKGVRYPAWTYNGTVPGPIIRATEGDLLRVTFYNEGAHPHTIHFHGIHPANMDGSFEIVPPGGKFVYEFPAEPFGCFVYHCHTMPLKKHIEKGLYGAFIVDPPTPRPPARELVMVMNGFDTDFDGENEFYTVNGIANYFAQYPIPIKVDELVRIYLINMTEFDLINSFHLHGNMFKLYRTGTRLEQYEYTDTVTLGQGERAILEFSYKYPGRYMFHAHQSEFAELGWMGLFDVQE